MCRGDGSREHGNECWFGQFAVNWIDPGYEINLRRRAITTLILCPDAEARLLQSKNIAFDKSLHVYKNWNWPNQQSLLVYKNWICLVSETSEEQRPVVFQANLEQYFFHNKLLPIG